MNPAPTLDRMLARLDRFAGQMLADHRAGGRFHGHDPHAGLCDLSTSPTPVIVPPVPPRATECRPARPCRAKSPRPSRRWTSGLAGFFELLRHVVVGMLGNQGFRLAPPGIPSLAGVNTNWQRCLSNRPLDAHALRHRHQPIAPRADIGQPDAVLPLVGSMITVSLLIRPSRRRPRSSPGDAVLHIQSGLKFSSFPATVAAQPSVSRQSGAKGVTSNTSRDIVKDLTPEPIRHCKPRFQLSEKNARHRSCRRPRGRDGNPRPYTTSIVMFCGNLSPL